MLHLKVLAYFFYLLFDKYSHSFLFYYKADILNDLKQDYLNSLEECAEVKYENIKKGFFHKFIDSLLRVAAPLL